MDQFLEADLTCLQRLQELYAKQPPAVDKPTITGEPALPAVLVEDSEPFGEIPAKLCGSDSTDDALGERPKWHVDRGREKGVTEWVLGPDLSANDAMHHFAPKMDGGGGGKDSAPSIQKEKEDGRSPVSRRKIWRHILSIA